MGDDLSAFIADGIEFIVGGTLFLLALTFLLFAIGWEPVEGLPGLIDDRGAASAVLLFVIVAYAVGVLVEAVSRMVFERILDVKTLRREAFWTVPKAVKRRDLPQPTSARKWFLGTGTRFVPDDPDDPKGHRHPVADEKFTSHDLATTVFVREYQRAFVMTAHVGLGDEIASQLKRLRLERVAFLSGFVALWGFAFAEQWGALVVWALVLVLVFFIVLKRLDRYGSAIARGYITAQSVKKKAANAQSEVPEPEQAST